MDKYTDHSLKTKLMKFLFDMDFKGMAVILAVELGMLFMAVYKGVGNYSFPVVMMMMAFTLIGYMITLSFHADKNLFIIVIVLLNLGFLVQQIQAGEALKIHDFITKLSIALVVALTVAVLYYFMADLLSKDVIILMMMLFQIGISGLMLVGGKVVGSMSHQGATISFHGITPFEFVKVIYIFVAAGLLCHDDKKHIHIFGMKMDREILFCIHTIILSAIFAICSELGTLMIVYISGLIMLWIFGKHRKSIIFLVILSILGFIGIWITCSLILLPMIEETPGILPGVAEKIVKRFAVALHPEQYMSDYGYQATRSLEAIAMGGWLGIGTERHRMILPESSNDFIFANIIQTCGLFMGLILVLFLFAFLKRGMTVADACENNYMKAMASGITILIIVEAIIHMSYNMAIFPVTGIPLYFVSQGFTAIVTGMTLISMLLVISAKNREDECNGR